MTRRKIKFIGGGINSAIGHSHLSACLMDGLWEVLPSFFSRTESINQQTHQKYNLPWLDHPQNLDEFLDDAARNPDLLVIVTPSTSHYDLVREVLDRRIPVLVEKPIACTIAESDLILKKLQADPSLYLRYVHNYSLYPMFQEMELRVKSGSLGEIKHIRAQAPSDGFARIEKTGLPQTWRQSDGKIPMIALDLATHLFHLVHRLVDPSSGKLVANTKRLAAPFDVIDNMQIHCEMDSGPIIDYWFSKAHLGFKNGLCIEVFGENGAFHWTQENPDQLIFADIDSNQTIVNRGSIDAELRTNDRFKAGHPTGFVESMGYFYNHLYNDLENFLNAGKPNPWINPAQCACAGVVFLEQAYQSAIEEEWIYDVLV